MHRNTVKTRSGSDWIIMTNKYDKIPLKSSSCHPVTFHIQDLCYINISLWHEVHCCHQKAWRFSHMNGFHPKFEQFKEEYWKIKCKLCMFPLNSFKENKWTSRWRMELHPTWKIVNICLKCFCIVHASCCHVMKKGGEIFKVICCGSAPLICGFCFFYSNSNGTNIQFW